MGDSFIIAAEGQGIYQCTLMLFSLEYRKKLHQLFGKTQQSFRLHPGSHDNGAVKPGPIRTKVITQDKGSHAVSHDQIRDSGIFLLRFLSQAVHILHGCGRRILPAEITVWMAAFPAFSGFLGALVYAFAMPQMIVAGDQNPFLCQINRKTIVAVDIFRHPMDNLQDTHRLSVRYPYRPMDFGNAVTGIIIKILFLHWHPLLSRLSSHEAGRRPPRRHPGISKSPRPPAFPFRESLGQGSLRHPPHTEACLPIQYRPASQVLSSQVPSPSYPPSLPRCNGL